MLARFYILSGKKNFDRVEDEGEIYQSKSFGLAYLNRGDQERSKFGFIISTKISKEAVVRNRVKRALSESVRFSLIYIKPGYDVIFLAKQKAAQTSSEELMREVKEALIAAGLFKE